MTPPNDGGPSCQIIVMVKNETTIGKIATLTAKLLSGWRVLTLKDAKAFAASVLARAPRKNQGK